MSPSLGTLKRGSFQVQKAAKEVKDKIGSRQLLTVFVTTGFVLCGVVEQSAPVALLANNPSPISAQEFADYVENTSYITRYCQPSSQLNISEEGDRQVHVVLSLPHIEIHAVIWKWENNGWKKDFFNMYRHDACSSLYRLLGPLWTSVIDEIQANKGCPLEPIPMSRTDETESVLREAFMWGTLVSPLAASRVAARAGAETLFGYGVLGTGVVALLVPAAWLSPYHVALRIVQGMCMGTTWPAAHMLAVTWFKPQSISGFVSSYTAVNLGYAVAGLLGTPLVRALGRDALSYVCTAAAVAWYVLWWRFVEEELSPIRPIRDEHRNLPWRRLLLSGPAWACGVAVVGSQWADATLMLGVTKYLKLVYGFSTAHEHVLVSLPHIGHFLSALLFGYIADHVRRSGVVSGTTCRKLLVYVSHFLPATLMFVLGYTGCDPTAPAALYVAAVLPHNLLLLTEHVLVSLPHIGHFLSALLFGYIADHVRRSGVVSGTTCRKLLVYVSHFLPATLMFVLGYTGCDPTAPAALYVAALLLTAATPAGVYASAADIAPNYAGTVFGLCQTIGAAGLLAANYVVSEGLHGSFAGWWRLVFSAASVVLLTTATAFMAFGSGSVQDWNVPEGECAGDLATASTGLVDPEQGADDDVHEDRADDAATDTE